MDLASTWIIGIAFNPWFLGRNIFKPFVHFMRANFLKLMLSSTTSLNCVPINHPLFNKLKTQVQCDVSALSYFAVWNSSLWLNILFRKQKRWPNIGTKWQHPHQSHFKHYWISLCSSMNIIQSQIILFSSRTQWIILLSPSCSKCDGAHPHTHLTSPRSSQSGPLCNHRTVSVACRSSFGTTWEKSCMFV